MPLIALENMPLVAMEFMNKVHQEDIEIINELYLLLLEYEQQKSQKNRELFELRYQEWFAHTVTHFAQEEEKMLAMNFPPYAMHKGEHQNALALMDQVYREWQNTQDIAAIKKYFSEYLPQWLTHHIQTMDTVTANFFKTGESPCSMG